MWAAHQLEEGKEDLPGGGVNTVLSQNVLSYEVCKILNLADLFNDNSW